MQPSTIHQLKTGRMKPVVKGSLKQFKKGFEFMPGKTSHFKMNSAMRQIQAITSTFFQTLKKFDIEGNFQAQYNSIFLV